MSKPLYQFSQTILRANSLVDIYEERKFQIASGTDSSLFEKDLIRAAVVTSVAAMDHFFTSKFSDILVVHLKSRRPSDELISILEKSGLNARTALEVVVMKRPFRRIRTMVQNHLSRYTSHRVEAIDKLFSSLGLKGLCGKVENDLNRRNLLRNINTLVLQRNEIVHTGHLNSHGQLKKIDEGRVKRLMEDVTKFVMASDKLINNFVNPKT